MAAFLAARQPQQSSVLYASQLGPSCTRRPEQTPPPHPMAAQLRPTTRHRSPPCRTSSLRHHQPRLT
eukprot:7253589-Heterocapsa_arctica.AAC.1